MPLQNYVDKVGPVVNAAWLNSVDQLLVSVFADATSPAQARAAITSDLPLEIANGGTSSRTASAALAALGGTTIAAATAAITATYIGSQIYPVTPAEILAGIAPTNTYYPELHLLRYFSVISTSIYTALATAYLVAAQKPGGGKVFIPAGAWQVTSVELATGWSVPVNTATVGEGEENTSITITGSAVTTCMFGSVNVGGIRFEGISFIGNSQSNSSGNGFFFYAQMTVTATAICRKFRLQNCSVSNFKGDYWVYFDNQNNTYAMRDIRIENNNFTSLVGNARDGTNIGVPSSCIAFRGSFTNAAGIIADCYVLNNIADCTYIKQFCISWHGSVNHKISKNIVRYPGQTGISDDTGAYAFLAYDNAHIGSPPDLIDWFDNSVISPRSCGFYCASGARIRAKRNFITGQTDINDGSIPKGAIAINQAAEFTADDNDFDDCYFGFSLVLPSQGVYKLNNNKIRSTKANGVAIKAQVAAGATAKLLEIDGIEIDSGLSNTTGIVIYAGSTYGFTKVDVRNFDISTTNNCLQFSTLDATTPKIQYVHIANGEVDGGVNYGISYRSMSDATSRATIESVVFNGNAGGAASILLSVASSLGLTLKNLTFNNYASGTGYAIETTSAQGRIEGVRFNNVATARRYILTGSEELAVDAPTWTGNDNDFVQDLNTTELGSAASKYTRQGWQWDATNAAWKEVRCLTGN